MYGLSAMMGCQYCGLSMSLKLRFGRPKTFEIRMLPDNQLIGYAGVEAAGDFIKHIGVQVFLPEGGADSEGGSPIRDTVMLGKLSDTIYGDDDLAVPQKRFESVWRKINCDHKHIRCQLYDNIISVECQDCASDLTFKQAANGKFSVEIDRLGVEDVLCGVQKTNKVFGFLRDNVTEIQLSETLADRMSEDPDRDAQMLTRLVTSMENAGLLYRVYEEEETAWQSIVQALSAFNHTRREFLDAIKDLKGIQFEEGGRFVKSRYSFEKCWLEWPCWFESDHFDVTPLDVDGTTGFCARCGHSTLDDEDDDMGYWDNGCRECGYNGYLSGIETPTIKDHMDASNRAAV